jgi:Mlc titration factor MtfA (ptsG expression regulator)
MVYDGLHDGFGSRQMLSWYKHNRRRRLLARPFSADWERFLIQNVAHHGRLAKAERAQLRNATRILVAEKHWEGCRGLRVTEEIRVTIAAQAALMLLGSPRDYFPNVLSILVYPSAFRLPREEDGGDGPVRAAAGVAFYRGPAILAWDRVLAEGRNPSAGRNVVVHEFAHHLDFLDGSTNGTPELSDGAQVARWGEVMTAEFTRLRRDVGNGRETVLGEYAGENEAEFFAVGSELFFTRPGRLRHYHARLYQLLADYYGVDPVGWFADEPPPMQASEARDGGREPNDSPQAE